MFLFINYKNFALNTLIIKFKQDHNDDEQSCCTETKNFDLEVKIINARYSLSF